MLTGRHGKRKVRIQLFGQNVRENLKLRSLGCVGLHFIHFDWKTGIFQFCNFKIKLLSDIGPQEKHTSKKFL